MESRQAERRPVPLPLAPRGAGDVETFVATIRRLSRAHSLQEVMATATPATRSLLGADGITFVLRDDDLCHYADEDANLSSMEGKAFSDGRLHLGMVHDAGSIRHDSQHIR